MILQYETINQQLSNKTINLNWRVEMDITAHVINKMRQITKDAAIQSIDLDQNSKAEMKRATRHYLNGIIMLFDPSTDKELAPVYVLENLDMWAHSFLEDYFSDDFHKCKCGQWSVGACDNC
jgi:hypothetical protein